MRLLYLDWPHLPLRLELAASPHGAELVVWAASPGSRARCSTAVRPLPGSGSTGAGRWGRRTTWCPRRSSWLAIAMPTRRRSRARSGRWPTSRRPWKGRRTRAIRRSGRPSWASRGWPGCGARSRCSWSACRGRSSPPLLPVPPRAGIGNTRFGAQVAAVAGSVPRSAAGSARRSRRSGHPVGMHGGGLPGAAPHRAAAGRRGDPGPVPALRADAHRGVRRARSIGRAGAFRRARRGAARPCARHGRAAACGRDGPWSGCVRRRSWTRRWRRWSRSGSCCTTCAARSASSSRHAAPERAARDAGADPGARRPDALRAGAARACGAPRSCWSGC